MSIENTPPKGFNEKYGDEVKSKFIEQFRNIGNNVREDHFQELEKFLSQELNYTNASINIENIVKDFRASLQSRIIADFETMWKDQEVDENLIILDGLKKQNEQNLPQTVWRPTGKTPAEQTKFYRIHTLNWKIKCLEKNVQLQRNLLDTRYMKIEEYRSAINEAAKKREQLFYQMDVRLKSIAEMNDELMQIRLDEFQLHEKDEGQ